MPRTGDSLTKEVFGTLGGYLAGQVKVACIVGLMYTVGFAIAGVPGWFLVGPLGGALNLVPMVGGVIALAAAGIATLLGNGTLYTYLGVLLTFIVVQAVEGFYLSPTLLGRRVGLRPIWVFVALAVGGLAFGPLGILFAVPVAAVAAVIWRRSRRPRI